MLIANNSRIHNPQPGNRKSVNLGETLRCRPWSIVSILKHNKVVRANAFSTPLRQKRLERGWVGRDISLSLLPCCRKDNEWEWAHARRARAGQPLGPPRQSLMRCSHGAPTAAASSRSRSTQAATTSPRPGGRWAGPRPGATTSSRTRCPTPGHILKFHSRGETKTVVFSLLQQCFPLLHKISENFYDSLPVRSLNVARKVIFTTLKSIVDNNGFYYWCFFYPIFLLVLYPAVEILASVDWSVRLLIKPVDLSANDASFYFLEIHAFAFVCCRFEMLKTADGSINGSLKVVESIKNNKKNKKKSKDNTSDWTWKEQVNLN